MNSIRESFYRKVAEKGFSLDEEVEEVPVKPVESAAEAAARRMRKSVLRAGPESKDWHTKAAIGPQKPGTEGDAIQQKRAENIAAAGNLATAAIPAAAAVKALVLGAKTVPKIISAVGATGAAAYSAHSEFASDKPADDHKPALPSGSNASTAPVAAPNGGTKQKAAAAAAERDKQGLQASGAPKPNEVQGPPTATQAAGTEKNSFGITKIETDSAQKAREAAAATASGNQPKPGTPEHNDISAQRPGSPEIKQVQQNMKDDPRPGDKENLAATLAKPDISSGDESAGLNMNRPNYGPNKPAAQQQAAPPSVKPRPAPSSVSTADTGGDKYGSGNASAGFERGKYAAPDAADNSSGANELRSKQQAVDRHQVNESKSKYMSESKNFEKFLRKNKYGKIT